MGSNLAVIKARGFGGEPSHEQKDSLRAKTVVVLGMELVQGRFSWYNVG